MEIFLSKNIKKDKKIDRNKEKRRFSNGLIGNNIIRREFQS
jgi:hypothetical protein